MYFITIKKSDGVVIDYRVDTSKPLYWTTDSLCAAISLNNKLPVADIETISFDVLPQCEENNFDGILTPQKHCFDTIGGFFYNNPNYVEPLFIRSWRLGDIRPSLNFGERVKWDNDKTDTIKTAKLELSYPRNQADTTEVLQLLVDAGDISAASMQKILA